MPVVLGGVTVGSDGVGGVVEEHDGVGVRRVGGDCLSGSGAHPIGNAVGFRGVGRFRVEQEEREEGEA